MRTTISPTTFAVDPRTDLTDLVFENKNRQYGAFILRKSYAKFLTIAYVFACSLFILGMSSPLIINFIKGSVHHTGTDIYIDTRAKIELGTIRDKDEDKETMVKPVEKIVENSIQFVAPKIVVDNELKVEYTPPAPDPETKLGRSTLTGETIGSIEDVNLPPGVEKGTFAPPVTAPEKPVDFFALEETPHFPGGDDQLMTYFASSIKYPPIALRVGVEGKVFVQFTLTKDGSVINAHIVKGIGAGCDEEALRVVKAMPAWTPGKQNGRAVPVLMSIPITFKIKQ